MREHLMNDEFVVNSSTRMNELMSTTNERVDKNLYFHTCPDVAVA